MDNHEIPEEFYDAVETVARQTQRKWPDVEWEDLRQQMWVWLLDNQAQLVGAIEEFEESLMKLRKVATQCAAEMMKLNDVAQGSYRYGTKHVRAMLAAGFLTDTRLGTISEYSDFQSGMVKLAENNPRYAQAIVTHYTTETKLIEPTERKLLQRSVDKLTRYMNQFRILQIEDYDGIGTNPNEQPFEVLADMFGGDDDLYRSNTGWGD